MSESPKPDMAVNTTSKSRSVLEKLIDYATENPIKILSTGILVFGGLQLLVYFLHIGFMPDVTLEAVTSLLYAVALLGLFIGVCSMLLLVVPGVLLAALGSIRKDASHDQPTLAMVAATALCAAYLFSAFEVVSAQSARIIAAFIILVALAKARAIAKRPKQSGGLVSETLPSQIARKLPGLDWRYCL